MANMIDGIIADIKDKKELKQLDNSYVRTIVEKELARNNKLAQLIKAEASFEKLKKKYEYELLFKDIRKKLRKAHGLFKSKDEYLSNYERDYDDFNKFLSEKIESFKPESIIDLGSGLNPLFISKEIYSSIKDYYAFEIDKALIEKLEKEKPSKKLKAGYFNLLDLEIPKELDKAKKKRCVILLLKVLEALEVFKTDFSEILIKHLKENFKDSLIIISFAKQSSSGSQKIRKSGRSWLRRILGRLEKQGIIKKINIEDIGNEIIFIIE